jgi:hypothetical protein
MFSITLCFASTSQAATTTAPAAPHGSNQYEMNASGSIPMLSNMATMNAVRTPPPSAIST